MNPQKLSVFCINNNNNNKTKKKKKISEINPVVALH